MHLLWAEYDSVLLYSNGTAKTTFLGVRIWHVKPHPGPAFLELKTGVPEGHQVDERTSLLLHPLEDLLLQFVQKVIAPEVGVVALEVLDAAHQQHAQPPDQHRGDQFLVFVELGLAELADDEVPDLLLEDAAVLDRLLEVYEVLLALEAHALRAHRVAGRLAAVSMSNLVNFNLYGVLIQHPALEAQRLLHGLPIGELLNDAALTMVTYLEF